MHFLTGENGPRNMWLPHLQRLGWGRMFVRYLYEPYPGEPWGLDNGAYGCWLHGRAWDGDAYRRRVEKAAELHGHSPAWLAVLPDVVADPGSLAFSLEWRERLSGIPLPWFLAVQDGMTPEAVAPHLPGLTGLFLGGTDAFKASAATWADLARGAGLRFHYARAGTRRKLAAARAVGADSCDSTRPIRDRTEFRRFERLWTHGDPQLELFDHEEHRLAIRRDRLDGRPGVGIVRRSRNGTFR